MSRQYADVIIDISHEKVDRTFQYKVPESLAGRVSVGCVVEIPFGKGDRLRTGYVIDITGQALFPEEKIKEIKGIVPDAVSAETNAIRLAWWMRERYGSTMIAALKTVLPVKQTMKHTQTKMVGLNVPPGQALELKCEADRKKQVGKARLLEALMDTEQVSYTMLTTRLAVSPQTIRSMREQGILRVETFETYRNPVKLGDVQDKPPLLTPEQRQIADDFLAGYDKGERRPALLHGITGSGKTEVYMRVIEGMLARGKEAIVLIPEIALTYQTVLRFYRRFGDVVSIVNSRLSQGEKYDQFERAKKGEVKIMIGPRTALFTPFQNLGLIVIDEEHEGSYKSEQVPRYHARETAAALAGIVGGRVLLGSATPSVEANYKAERGEYQKYVMTSRIGVSCLPGTELIDLRDELKHGNKSILSGRLQELMEDRLQKGEQVMLFLNRRGVAGFVSCRACGYVAKCPHCDVSLSEHRTKMVCHYCGHEQPKYESCPSCGSKYIAGFKAGTQQVEDAVKKLFPKSRVLRMDADTTKRKDDHEKILAAFANEEADILIGTQMIVKGHDFKKVTLVGVLAADLSLFDADFMSSERTFQLLVQAVGRAGRGEAPGLAVIQTYRPDHFAVVRACEQDYDGFYREEIAYRSLMEYPPAYCLMTVMVTGKDERQTIGAAQLLAKALQSYLKSDAGGAAADRTRLIGPAQAAIGKIKDVYRQILYVKCGSEQDMIRCRDALEAAEQTYADEMKQNTVYYDVAG